MGNPATQGLQARAASSREAALRKLRMATKPVRVAKELFLNEKGDISDNGAYFINYLSDKAEMGKDLFCDDPRKADFRAGKQQMVLEVLRMFNLDEKRIKQLDKQLEGNKHG